MTIDPDIRDQAYQFFIEEASELLDIIEAGILNLRHDGSVQQVHEVMRAAHSIKGGAASVELDAIKTIAHRLEDAFKALYSDTVIVDEALETLLLRAYDGLRHPLQAQIETGTFNEKQSLAAFDSAFSELEERLGPALDQVNDFMPSAADLGVNIVASIFEVDVADVLTQLRQVLKNPQDYDCAQSLQTQLEVLTGLAELVDLPRFTELMGLAQMAASQNRHQLIPVIEQVVLNVDHVRTAVLNEERMAIAQPSDRLMALANGEIAGPDAPTQHDASTSDPTESDPTESDPTDILDLADLDLAALDESMGYDLASPSHLPIDVTDIDATDKVSTLEEIWSIDAVEFPSVERIDDKENTDGSMVADVDTLADVWGAAADVPDVPDVLDLPDVSDVSDVLADAWGAATDVPDVSDVSDVSDVLADVWGAADVPDVLDVPLDVEVTDFEAVVTDRSLIDLSSTESLASWTEQVEISQSDAEPSDMPDQVDTPAPEDFEHINPGLLDTADTAGTIDTAVSWIGHVHSSLPTLGDDEFLNHQSEPIRLPVKEQSPPTKKTSPTRLSAKVALDRLERMDNLVGELTINRNSLSLRNDQFQYTVHQLGKRFSSFRRIVKQLQSLSDYTLISPERKMSGRLATSTGTTFDSLEMDSYSEINLLLEGVLEEVFQLAEAIEDVALFAGQSNQLLEHQRRTLKQLRNELMWSRMVPLDQVLKRFPRVMRELATTYQKPVQLKLTGTDVLVDRVMLEKLYDPLLHLVRNAFDHGIESPAERQKLGKPEQGTIEIRSYHQGNYTVIDVSDDGRGMDLEKIAQRALEVQLCSLEQLSMMSKQQIQQLIFEPGFSTARTVSELSGRGVGLDVVRESLQAFNGKLSLTTTLDKGTVFSLKVPLTLTLTKLVVGGVGNVLVALGSDGIEEILRPTENQLKQSSDKCFLHWRGQIIPMYGMADLLKYQCQLPEQLPQVLQAGQAARQTAKGQQSTILIMRQGRSMLALGLDHIVTEQELVIKPMGKAIAAPSYINGCAVLADGSLVPVIDGLALVQYRAGTLELSQPLVPQPQPQLQRSQTIMIIDDSSALRRTLALTLSKAGYGVVQAKDGRDGLDQLQHGAQPDLIICDVEMPRLNGFEFLSRRRSNLTWASIPTVMLTSRSNHKHRTLAKHLGATHYFTKPYIEKDFLDAIAALLQQ